MNTCPRCGEEFEYLVDLGFCEECLSKEIDKEEE